MIIGIDGNEANVENRVGIGEYAYELLKKFEEFRINLPAGRQDFQFITYLKSKPLDHMPKEWDGWRYRVIGPKKFWTQIGLPFDLYFHKPRPDIFFTPTHYAPRFSPMPTVISVMDLSYIHFPELFTKHDLYQLREWTKYSVKNARKIFTISNASKNDIINYYKVEEKRVVVTYPGIKKESKSMNYELRANKIKEKYGIKGDYILFVGTLQPRKNIARLIEAFAKIKKQSLELIIIGKKGWLYENIISAPKKFSIEDRVKFLDFITDEELESFYQNAVCFVLPSLYEGFGLPVLEAMKNGCPVLTSNVSSLPEAGGDAALYFNPLNSDEIASVIQKVVDDDKLRREMIKKGYNQVKKFSWEKTAKQTLSVLQKLSKKSS